MNYSKEELNEAYRKLPEDLKEVFLSIDVTDSINNIGKKYSLHINQIGELDSETGLVLLGLTHPTEFVSNLTKRLGVDRVVASQVASDINDQVFLKVRDLLKQVQHTATEAVGDNTEAEEPAHPSKDALLAAIEHPEGMLKKPLPIEAKIPLVAVANPYAPAKPEMGKDVPVVAPTPSSIEKPVLAEVSEDSTLRRLNLQKPDLQATDILTQKLSGQFSLPQVETKAEAPSATPTKRVDPYKEQI